MSILFKTRTKAEPKEEAHDKPRTQASDFWAEAKKEHEAAFRAFADGQTGDDAATAAQVFDYLKPLQKKSWQVMETWVRKSWKNALASAGVQRRKRQAS